MLFRSQGLAAEARAAGVEFIADAVGGMFGLYFANTLPQALSAVSQSNIARFNLFFHAMLDEGVYLAPSAYEAGFVSACHDDAVLDETLSAARVAFKRVAAA